MISPFSTARSTLIDSLADENGFAFSCVQCIKNFLSSALIAKQIIYLPAV